MNKLQQQKEAFICEKEIREVDFGPFGITDKFKALGWEAALKCYDNEVKTMYDQQIQEWMATLECPLFKAPNKMKLIGTVNGKNTPNGNTCSITSLSRVLHTGSC
uniref:Uncharacterized protein n=1 Tax=Helianthus annuus TaxID=4232 RepID=A0A251S9F7_HELAN